MKKIYPMLVMFAALSASGEMANGIKAIVHDSIVTYQEVEDYTAPAADLLRRQNQGDPEAFQKKISAALDENLETLLERQLILRDFEVAGYNLPESIIDEEVEQRIRGKFGDRATLTKTLQAQGITFEKFRKGIRDQIIIDALRAKHISQELIISPHKIETYYVEHKEDFKTEDEVKLRMIVLNKPSEADAEQTKKLAEEILLKITDVPSFAEMAGTYSQGSQRYQGGDWGWVAKLNPDGESVLRKELADVAFSLKPGEKSGVIETPEADYIMLVEDKRAAHIKSLNEVRDDVEKTLLAKERARLQKLWIDRLKKKTFVRYF